jgi:serine/threonine-protein kinase
VVAYECLAGRPPFTASEPLAIAFAHKHEPVPPLPADVPEPVADLVYHMLAKTPEERPVNVRAVADRADMLRDALALGETAQAADYQAADYAGRTRADMPAAATGALLGGEAVTGGRAGGPAGRDRAATRRRRTIAAAATAGLCALAAVIGLYLSGHIAGQVSGNAGSTTSPHASNSLTVSPSQGVTTQLPQPTPTSSLVAIKPVPSSNSPVPPQPKKSAKPTTTPTQKTSPTHSASASASSSPTGTTSPTTTASATATSSPTS